jgi:hypothetical protein
MPLLEGLYPTAEKLGHNLMRYRLVVTNTRFSSATELTIAIYYTIEGLYPTAEKLGHNLMRYRLVVTNTRFSSATELTIAIYYTIADFLCDNEFLRATLHQR